MLVTYCECISFRLFCNFFPYYINPVTLPWVMNEFPVHKRGVTVSTQVVTQFQVMKTDSLLIVFPYMYKTSSHKYEMSVIWCQVAGMAECGSFILRICLLFVFTSFNAQYALWLSQKIVGMFFCDIKLYHSVCYTTELYTRKAWKCGLRLRFKVV